MLGIARKGKKFWSFVTGAASGRRAAVNGQVQSLEYLYRRLFMARTAAAPEAGVTRMQQIRLPTFVHLLWAGKYSMVK